MNGRPRRRFPPFGQTSGVQHCNRYNIVNSCEIDIVKSFYILDILDPLSIGLNCCCYEKSFFCSLKNGFEKLILKTELKRLYINVGTKYLRLYFALNYLNIPYMVMQNSFFLSIFLQKHSRITGRHTSHI
jgi:hypothetical protein